MEEKQYFYLDGTMQMGPSSFKALQKAAIRPDTMVWNSTLPDWVEAQSLPEFQAFFAESNTNNEAPPIPPSSLQASDPMYSHLGGNYNFEGNPYSYNNPNRPPMPESYMVWAILTTLFCCLPLGVVSIISASKVSTAYAVGDYLGAQKASEDAKKWATWSALSTVIAIGAYIAFYIYFILIIATAGMASSC